MKVNRINLVEYFPELETMQSKGTLDCYCLAPSQNTALNTNRPAVVICPGGGYLNVMSQREGEPIAMEFLARGYQVFVLEYSVNSVVFPVQLLELSASVAYIRRNQGEFGVDIHNISVIGFSAGGHLACSLGVFWQLPLSYEALHLNYEENKPNQLILAYPVISTDPSCVHVGSFENLMGSKLEDISQELLEQLSLERHVTDNMSKTFVFHTFSDQVVSVENSLCLLSAMKKNQVLCEGHLYQQGFHGIALASHLTTENQHYILPHVASWLPLALDWLELDDEF